MHQPTDSSQAESAALPSSTGRWRRALTALLTSAFITAGCSGEVSPRSAVDTDVATAGRCMVDHERPVGTITARRAGDDDDRVLTFAERFRDVEVSVPGIAAHVREMSRRFEERQTFTLETTGITVELLSDGPVAVNEYEFDRLIAMITGAEHPGVDRATVELLRCYHEALMETDDLAGRRLRLLVPADPEKCFVDLTVRRPPDGHCNSTGLALPRFDVEVRAFRMPVAHLTFPDTVVVAPGAGGDRDPRRAAALVLAHELVHYLDNQMGNLPPPDDHFEYEARAYAVERALRERSRAGRLNLPLPISYPERGSR
jgi:hypothetical protein